MQREKLSHIALAFNYKALFHGSWLAIRILLRVSIAGGGKWDSLLPIMPIINLLYIFPVINRNRKNAIEIFTSDIPTVTISEWKKFQCSNLIISEGEIVWMCMPAP
jgi:hypothetical protein